MNAIIKSHLTDPEAQEAVDKALELARGKWRFFLESFTEQDNFLGTMLHRAYIERDWIRYGEIRDQLDWQYFKACGLDEVAKVDARDSKYVDLVSEE